MSTGYRRLLTYLAVILFTSSARGEGDRFKLPDIPAGLTEKQRADLNLTRAGLQRRLDSLNKRIANLNADCKGPSQSIECDKLQSSIRDYTAWLTRDIARLNRDLEQIAPLGPTYSIGDIPPQRVWSGNGSDEPLRFVVTTRAPHPTYSIDVDGQPAGSLEIDPTTGTFVYVPDKKDKVPFAVTFHAQANNDTESNRVEITPMPHVKPETDLVSGPISKPDPSSSDYIVISRQTAGSGNPVLSNGKEAVLQNVSISGKTIVIDGKNDANNLFGLVDNKDNVASLSIFAETIIIRTPLRIPGTDLTIYAREIRFEDRAPNVRAVICTTPLNNWEKVPPAATDTEEAKDGVRGQRGGNVKLFIHDFYSQDARQAGPRFILTGGDGQPGGAGKDGPKGPDLVPISGDAAGSGSDVVYLEHSNSNSPNRPYKTWGTRSWPSDGLNAKAAGAPGVGGPPGALYCESELGLGPVSQEYGHPGPIGAPTVGGEPGNPIHSKWIKVVWHQPMSHREGGNSDARAVTELMDQHDSRRGNPALPRLPRVSNEPRPSFREIDGPQRKWIHPLYVQSVLEHAKDSYLAGDFALTRVVLREYLELVDQALHIPDRPELEMQLNHQRTEMESLLNRLESGRDYFGNPPGWAPMLSLEYNLQAFNQQVDSAIEVLYLAYWVRVSADAKQAKIDGLKEALKHLSAELDGAVSEYNAQQNAIPALQTEATNIRNEMESTLGLLKQREQALADQAARNTQSPISSAARVLSAACKSIPVYQPALGAVGKGLDLITNFDSSKPFESLSGVDDIVEAFSKAKLEQSRASLEAEIAKITETPGDIKSRAKGLVAVGKDFAKAYHQINQAMEATRIPKDELDAELQRLKANDPGYGELIGKVGLLSAEKEDFANRLSRALQSIATLSEKITTNLIYMDTLRDRQSDLSLELDQQALQYINDMQLRARERLVKFQYYLAKAYEYRFLKPYPAPLNLTKLMTKIQTIVTPTEGNAQLSLEKFKQLKTLYVDALSSMISEGIGELENNPPEKSITIGFGLEPSELTELNRRGKVFVDLRERIPPNRGGENRRISSLEVDEDGSAAHIEGTHGATAYLTITLEHSGETTLRSRGHNYVFAHARRPEDKPYTWAAVIDPLVTGKHVNNEIYSVAGLSLLRNLIGMNSANWSDSRMLPYVNPGAEGRLGISLAKNSPAIDLRLDKLRVRMVVDFVRTGGDEVILNVGSNTTDVSPLIQCSMDKTGRGDGYGSFQRTFAANQQVNLAAPLSYGKLKFKHWTHDSQVVTTPDISISMSEPKTIQVSYE